MLPELEDTALPGEAAVAAATPRPLAFTETQAGVPRPSAPGEGLASGRQLAHFRIDRLLGAGGMGEVYLATDLALDRPVALKVVAEGTATAARRERLIREARAQARIYHPNVCHIYYIGESEGLLFFAMELVTGQTFSERIAQGPVVPDEALELVRMAALGLREATRCGFTHRDVKPSNLMIDQHGNVKVMDFGLVAGSGAVAEDGGGSVEQTSMAGTPLYMAPEQARGEAIDFRADIYALGATLYHLVAGKPPFAGETFAELLHQHASAERPALQRTDIATRALAPVAALCARMMDPTPARRPASYDELIRDLELLSSVRNRSAGATVRVAALSIDALVLLPALAAMDLGLARLFEQELDDNLTFVCMMLVYRFVLIAWRGRTLGQAIFELEVIDQADGHKPSWRQTLRRMLFQAGPIATAAVVWLVGSAGPSWVEKLSGAALPVAFVATFLMVFVASWRNARRLTWWDRRSHTMVRYRPR